MNKIKIRINKRPYLKHILFHSLTTFIKKLLSLKGKIVYILDDFKLNKNTKVDLMKIYENVSLGVCIKDE